MLEDKKTNEGAETKAAADAEREYERERYGQWVKDDAYKGKNKEIFRCSLCGHYETVKKNGRGLKSMSYCHACGAAMLNGFRLKKRGEWLRDSEHFGKRNDIYRCSLCAHVEAVRRDGGGAKLSYMNYCPDCGAEMARKDEREGSERDDA